MSENTPNEARKGADKPVSRLIKPIFGHWGASRFPITSEERYRQLFNIAPVCEVCGAEPAIALSCFDGFTNWKFCGSCVSDTETYTIPLADFFERPASVVDWLAHMQKKPGMDWDSFGRMMLRLREATGSRGGVGPSYKGRKS